MGGWRPPSAGATMKLQDNNPPRDVGSYGVAAHGSLEVKALKTGAVPPAGQQAAGRGPKGSSVRAAHEPERLIGLDVHAASTTCGVIEARQACARRWGGDERKSAERVPQDATRDVAGVYRGGYAIDVAGRDPDAHVTELAVVHVCESRGSNERKRHHFFCMRSTMRSKRSVRAPRRHSSRRRTVMRPPRCWRPAQGSDQSAQPNSCRWW